MPSGRNACPHITDNKDGTVTVNFSPTERGLHKMDIRYDGNHIPGEQLQMFTRLLCLLLKMSLQDGSFLSEGSGA